MATFDNREDAFEKRFAVDEEIAFKARARRNKRIGLWAAELLGKQGAEAESFADALVAAQAAAGDDSALAASLAHQFEAAGVDMSERRVARRLDEALQEARSEILAGK